MVVRTKWIARGLEPIGTIKVTIPLIIGTSPLGQDVRASNSNVCGCFTRLSQMEQVPTAREAKDRYPVR